MFSNTANSTDFFGYQERLEEAMQGALSAFTREILAEVKENGLKGDHAIYLTISTGPKMGVVMSDKLREKWPEELLIALQHQFVLGEVGYEEFEVVLTFSGETELPQFHMMQLRNTETRRCLSVLLVSLFSLLMKAMRNWTSPPRSSTGIQKITWYR